MFFIIVGSTVVPFFPLLKLALAFFGFKESAVVGKHIVHDGLQDVFRHVAFCAAVTEGVFELNAQARPEAAVFVCLNIFPVRFKPQGDFFFEFALNLRGSFCTYKLFDGFLAVLLFQFSK